MQTENSDQRLSLIPTQWSLIHQAHCGPPEVVDSARHQLLERYGGAAKRYLRKVMRSNDAADEVFQEFALGVLHGDLRGADPKYGRFRSFVKGTLFHLIADYRKRQRRWPGPLPAVGCDPALMPDDPECDAEFIESWRDELLARAWAALAASDTRPDQPFYAVLRFRSDHPKTRSPEAAEQLTARFGSRCTAEWVRQVLHRARQKFAELLIEEVAHSLELPTDERLEQELIELGLFEYCRPLVERRQGLAAADPR